MEYNPKLDYQFCKNLIVGTTNENEYRLRQVFFLKEKPISELEHRVLLYKDMLSVLKSSNDHINDLMLIYEKLYLEKLSVNQHAILKRVLAYSSERLVYQRLAESKLYSNKEEFIALVFTSKRFMNNLHPVVFYKVLAKVMCRHFENGSTDEAYQIFDEMLTLTNNQNFMHRLVNKKEITELIHDKQSEVRRLFGIYEVYLVGSCARDEMDQYSDVDLVVITRCKDSYLIAKSFKEIVSYYEHLFKMPVDLKIGGKINEVNMNKNCLRDLCKVY